MPIDRRSLKGHQMRLDPPANNRKQLEKKCEDVLKLIRRKFGNTTSIPHTRMPARAGTDLRLDLQGPPYKKFGVWWANFAVQRGKKVYGSLEVECGVDFKSGELAEAMIEAVANAHETRREAVNKYVVVNEWQYVLWQTARPPDVIQCAHLLHSHA